MRIPFNELKSQFLTLEEEIRAAINRVLESGWYVLGQQVEGFEQEFATYIGRRFCIGVGSGTDAIHLALRAIGIQPGDEVITVANTCAPTVCGIMAAGAKPVLVDCNDQTLAMDPTQLEKSITKKTKAVVPVHLYGNPCDMDPICDVAARHKLMVVEDCAQAHGASYCGTRCGAIGHVAAFSFYPTKNLGAMGDGGAVVTEDEHIAARVRRLRCYGESERNNSIEMGINSRLDEMQAAILRVKLQRLDLWNAIRRELAALYRQELQGLPLRFVNVHAGAESVFHMLVVRTHRRNALRAWLATKSIGTLVHYPLPIHLQEAFSSLGKGPGSFPHAERACDEVLSLPLYPELLEETVNEVTREIRSWFAAAQE